MYNIFPMLRFIRVLRGSIWLISYPLVSIFSCLPHRTQQTIWGVGVKYSGKHIKTNEKYSEWRRFSGCLLSPYLLHSLPNMIKEIRFGLVSNWSKQFMAWSYAFLMQLSEMCPLAPMVESGNGTFDIFVVGQSSRPITGSGGFNSLKQSDAYMRQWTKPYLA